MCAGGPKKALLGPKMAIHGKLTDVPNHFGQKALCLFEAKNQVLSEMIPKSPNGPKMAPNDQKHVILVIGDHFGPS